MPGSDATHSSVTSMGLSWQEGSSPSLGDTGHSVSLGDSDDVDDLAFFEEIVDLDLLFEHGLGVVDLLGDVGSSVDLDFHDVGLLGVEVLEEVWLGVHDHSNDGAVSLHALELDVGLFVVEVLDVLGESLLLGSVPVLVESSFERLVKRVSPDSGESSESSGGLDVPNNTDNLDGRGFDDGDSLNDFLLVDP